MDLTADKTNLNTLLSVPGQQFIVPEYQRPYAWGNLQIDEFWGDIVSSMSETRFLGSIVLNNEDKDQPQIIDGQQRLTTLTIILALIRDRYVELQSSNVGSTDQILANWGAVGDREFKLRSGAANWDVFRDFVLRKPTDPLRRSLTNDLGALDKAVRLRNKQLVANVKRLDAAIEDFLDDAESAEQGLLALERKLRTGLELVSIKVGSVSDAFLLFETLNDRGLQLSAADLLKSHLLSKVAQKYNDQSMVDDSADQWDDLIDKMGGTDITRFLRHYLLMTRSKVTKGDVFAEFKKETEDHGPTKLLARLMDYGSHYGQLLDPGVLPTTSSNASLRSALIDIQGQNVISHYVLLLPALKHLEPAASAKIARLVEMLSFRWIVCGLNAQELESFYAKTGRMLETSEGDQADEIAKLIIEQLPSSEEFRGRFVTMKMTTKYVTRYVLRRIEEGLNPTSELKESDEVHIEHVMPQSPSPSWAAVADSDSDDYAGIVQRWGNLTLLHAKPNVDISNGPFELKKEKAFSKSKVALTSQLMNSPTWGPHEIDARQAWMAVVADYVWSPASMSGAGYSGKAFAYLRSA